MTIYTSHSCPSDGKTIARDMSVVRIAECFKEYIITANHPNTRMLSATILGYWRHKYVTHPDQSPRREGKDVGSMNLTLRCDADDKRRTGRLASPTAYPKGHRIYGKGGDLALVFSSP